MAWLDNSNDVSDVEIGKYLARSINLYANGHTELASKLQDRARLLMRRKMQTAIISDDDFESRDLEETHLSA